MMFYFEGGTCRASLRNKPAVCVQIFIDSYSLVSVGVFFSHLIINSTYDITHVNAANWRWFTVKVDSEERHLILGYKERNVFTNDSQCVFRMWQCLNFWNYSILKYWNIYGNVLVQYIQLLISTTYYQVIERNTMFAHVWSSERKQVPPTMKVFHCRLRGDDSVADLSTLFTASITDVRGRRSCLRLKVFVRPQSESQLPVPAPPSSAPLLLCSSLISSCLLLSLCPSRQLLQELRQLAGRGGLWRQQSQLLRAQRLVGSGATRCLTRPLLPYFVFVFASRSAATI